MKQFKKENLYRSLLKNTIKESDYLPYSDKTPFLFKHGQTYRKRRQKNVFL